MDENETTAQERLDQIEAERKILKEQVKSERDLRLEEAAKMRVGRDEKIEKIQEKLKKVQAEIYTYNKLGKVAKIEYDILGIISREVNSTDEEVIADSADETVN